MLHKWETAQTVQGLGTLLEPHRKQVEGYGLRQKTDEFLPPPGSPRPSELTPKAILRTQ